MEGKTPTEKVHSLSNLVATLAEQMKDLDAKVKEQAAEHARTAQALVETKGGVIRVQEQLISLQSWKNDLPSFTDIKIDVAILRREVDKLEKVKDEWSRRMWAIAGPVLGAAVGWALGYFSRR